MIPDRYHFLVIDLLVAVFPLALAYEKRIRFLGQWKAVFTAVAVSGGIFLAFEELFIRMGIRGYNEQFLIGVYAGTFPMEAYLLFFSAPIAFLFLYRALIYLVRKDVLASVHISITWFFLLCTVFLGTYFYPKLYTSACFFLAAILMSLQMFVFKSKWLGRFYMAFFASLAPFFALNSWLCGAFTEEPIIWHNAMETIGIDLFSMPMEDVVFLLAFMLLATMVYERSLVSKRSRV